FVNPETLIPSDHPLRTIKRFADAALLELSTLFDEMYAADGQGRASIPPERLLKASLLISLYSVRSERAFCEELTYHLLFRWFLDMDLLEPKLRSQHVFQEPRAAVAPPRQSRVLRRSGAPGRSTAPAERRALQCGRHLDRSSGESQELSTQGRTATAEASRWWQSEQSLGRLPRAEALECDPPEHDRSRCAAVSQRAWQGSSPQLHGPGADGESAWHAGGLPGHNGHRHGRAGRGAAPDQRSSLARVSSQDTRRRQGL